MKQQKVFMSFLYLTNITQMNSILLDFPAYDAIMKDKFFSDVILFPESN